MFGRPPTRKPAVPNRRRVPTWVLWVALAAVVGAVLIWAGYTRWPDYSGFTGKTAWDWLGLIGISLAISLVGWIVTRKQRERDEAIALERAQDEALAAYLDQMSNLMVDQKLGERQDSLKESVRKVAQARTIAALLGLDREHKRRPLKLVYELELLTRGKSILELKNAGLDHANLSELTLREANLKCADLRATNLSGADLSGSDLTFADLRGVNLRRANLTRTDLTDANLLPYDEQDPERWSQHHLGRIKLNREHLRPSRLRHPLIHRRLTVTDLSEAILVSTCLQNAHLGGVDLRSADLSNADLTDADLTDADLSSADLSGAKVSRSQMAACKSLKGVTMPDGTKHE